LLHFLSFVASNGGLMPLVEVHGGYQQDRITGGTQQLSEHLAGVLAPGAVHLDEPVRRVAQDDAGVTVNTEQSTYRSERVIISVPLAIAGHIEYVPPLPEGRERLHREVVMGHTVKVFVAYERPFWQSMSFSGQAVGTSGLLSVVFENTDQCARTHSLLGLVVGQAARSFVEMSCDQRKQRILEELTRFFGPAAAHPIDYADHDWSHDRFSGGCPTGLFNVGTLSQHGDMLRRPIGRIHWAGTETARQCVGYMEGALESGERAADEIVRALGENRSGAGDRA
jgi:monoamine oxidase